MALREMRENMYCAKIPTFTVLRSAQYKFVLNFTITRIVIRYHSMYYPLRNIGTPEAHTVSVHSHLKGHNTQHSGHMGQNSIN